MPIPAIPDALPRWATVGADVSEPSSGRKDTGHTDDQVADTGEENWLKNRSYQWLDHMKSVMRRAQPGSMRTSRLGSETVPFNAIVAGNRDVSGVDREVVVAVGDTDGSQAICYTSLDGQDWAAQTLTPNDADLRALAHDPSITERWVAVGEGPQIISAAEPTVLGGSGWTGRTVPGDITILTAVASSGAGTYVAVGGATTTTQPVTSSSDGVTWTIRSIPEAATLYDVIWAASLFVAVGGVTSPAAAKIFTSADGATWTERSNPGTINIRGITWNGRRFVTRGENGETLTSADGIAWTLNASTGLDAIGAGNTRAPIAANPSTGLVVAMGSVPNGLMLSEDDGATFETIGQQPRVDTPNTHLVVSDLSYGNGRLWLAGDQGHVGRTDRLAP